MADDGVSGPLAVLKYNSVSAMPDFVAPFIGTAGWQHAQWRNRFYPAPLASNDWLRHYGQHLNCVELDAGRLTHLDAQLAAQWGASVAANFRFTIQMPRAITHIRKLRHCEAQIEAALYKVQRLEMRLGPLVFSLPPRWQCNLRRLEDCLASLPRDFRYVFEFQDPSWLQQDCYALLRAYNAALCVTDRMPNEARTITTSDFTYARLYGPPATGRYTSIGLRSWVSRLAGWQRHGLQCHVLFQSGTRLAALKNACLLRDYEAIA